jgi:hypothetical protein
MTGSSILAFLFAGVGAVSVAQAEPPPVSACLGETEQAGAAEVLDARSIRLADGRVLRVAGIEPFDFYLADAAGAQPGLQRRIGELIGGDVRFHLTVKEPDRYGRLPALLLTGGELSQEILAREGLAIAFATGETLPCFDRILAAEADARMAHRGYWKDHQSLPDATPTALAAQIGRFTIFEGRVVSVGNRTNRTYLNFGRRWTEDVTVEISAADREAFGGEEKLAAFARHRVRVRGFLEEKGGSAMVLRSPMQLEALDPVKETIGKAP